MRISRVFLGAGFAVWTSDSPVGAKTYISIPHSFIVHLSLFSRSVPVLFPYQSRFNSDLSPFFLSLALGKEGGCFGGVTGVLPDLPPYIPLISVHAVPLVACRSLRGWSMDASTFPRISSAPRSVRSGRAPKEHRRKGGGGIDQPGRGVQAAKEPHLRIIKIPRLSKPGHWDYERKNETILPVCFSRFLSGIPRICRQRRCSPFHPGSGGNRG